VLGNVAVRVDVEVLEDGLEMHALGLNCLTEVFEEVLDLYVMVSEVLLASEESVFVGKRSNAHVGVLVNSCDGESLVDALAEVNVVDKDLGVVSLVLVCEAVEFVICEVEVHAGEDRFELAAGNASLAELIKVNEELFNTNALHNDNRADTVFNVGGVVRNIDLRLKEAIVDDIQLASLVLEESALLSAVDSVIIDPISFWILCNVGWVDGLGTVNIMTELPVVDLLRVSKVTVSSGDKAKVSWVWWHQSKGF